MITVQTRPQRWGRLLTEKVWRFGGSPNTFPGAQPDPPHRPEYLYELYQRAKPDYTSQITVPVLWDKRRDTIILRMPNSGFGDLADNRLDLYPK